MSEDPRTGKPVSGVQTPDTQGTGPEEQDAEGILRIDMDEFYDLLMEQQEQM